MNYSSETETVTTVCTPCVLQGDRWSGMKWTYHKNCNIPVSHTHSSTVHMENAVSGSGTQYSVMETLADWKECA